VFCPDDADPYVYDPAEDRWWSPARPPHPHPSSQQAGEEFVWTGDVAIGPGRVYHPGTDHWAPVAGLPVAEEAILQEPYVDWTGEALLVFGGVRLSCPLNAECDVAADAPETLSGWLYVN
jgi:hypothetical protein